MNQLNLSTTIITILIFMYIILYIYMLLNFLLFIFLSFNLKNPSIFFTKLSNYSPIIRFYGVLIFLNFAGVPPTIGFFNKFLFIYIGIFYSKLFVILALIIINFFFFFFYTFYIKYMYYNSDFSNFSINNFFLYKHYNFLILFLLINLFGWFFMDYIIILFINNLS